MLRLGHRRDRDKRITTHVGLVARAFGANRIILSGEYDENVLESLRKVTETWGGVFEIKYEKNWKYVIKKFKTSNVPIVHLTMYGLNINDVMSEVKRELERKQRCLVIVGAEKVPYYIYEVADYNLAIGNQPHSEVAALAVFLDRLFEGKELQKEFENAKVKVLPQKKGKKLLKFMNSM